MNLTNLAAHNAWMSEHMIKKFVFAKKLMVGAGCVTSDQDWHDRQSEFLEQLRAQFPLDSLLYAEVAFEYDNTNGQTQMIAFIRPPTGTSATPSELERQTDLFAQDKRHMVLAASKLKEVYAEARMGSRDPAIDRHLTQRRLQLRSALREGGITLFTKPEGERVPLDSLPKWMPVSQVVQVRFQVNSMRRDQCHILIQSVRPLEPSATNSPKFAEVARKQTATLVRRSDARGLNAGTVFCRSIETGLVLSANVHIDRNWCDGQVGRWSIRETPREVANGDSSQYVFQQEILDLDTDDLAFDELLMGPQEEAGNDTEADEGRFSA